LKPIYFNTLVDFNKSLVKNASVLVLIISDKFLYDRKSTTNQFNAGAAWQNIALQAYDMRLVIHGISGFDYNKIRINLNVPENYNIIASFVIGKPASKEKLSKELQEKEIISNRKELSEIIVEGKFK